MKTNPVAPEQWGPRLYAYLDAHWRAAGTNANAWTHEHSGIQGATVSRWQGGTVPSLQAMRAVADALNVSMLDVLVAAGVMSVDEAGRDAPAPAAPSIDAAIENDPALTTLQRRTMRDLLAALRAVESGQAVEVRATPKGKRAR